MHPTAVRLPLPHLVAAAAALLAVAPAGPLMAQAPAANQARAPLTVEEVLRIRELADRQQVDLAPDGELVAYAVVDPRRAAAESEAEGTDYFRPSGAQVFARGADIYLTDARTGVTRNLTAGRGASWGPVWSPDGRALAFYSDRDGRARLWLWDRAGDSLRRVSEEIVRPYFGFENVQWSPDGRTILVKLLPAGMTLESARRLLPEPGRTEAARAPRRGVTAVEFSAMSDTAPGAAAAGLSVDSARSFMNAALADLALVDVGTGRVRRITPRARVMAYHFSPDGQWIAYTVRQPDGGRGSIVWNRYDLHVVDTTGRALASVPRLQQEYGLNVSWSPDGRRLVATDNGALRVITVGSGAPPQRIARDGVALGGDYRAPLWLDGATLLLVASDTLWRASLASGTVAAVAAIPGRRLLGLAAPAHARRIASAGAARTVLVVTLDPVSKRQGVHRVSLRDGSTAPLFEDDLALGGSDLPYRLDTGRDGALAFVAERASHPEEIWLLANGASAPRRLTELNREITDRPLGRSRLVSWRGPGGDTLRGALLLPADYVAGRRYPLVVKVYGGSRLSNVLNRFGLESGVDNLQMLATRGYAVLLPDAPLRTGTPMADLAAAVLPALDSVVAIGVADADRLGLMGHSYGGYSVLALLVQTDRFRAAVSSGGFSNLVSQYGAMREDGSAVGLGWSERGQGRMGGSPWEFRDRYIDNSPFFFLDRVRAPVLLMHGGADHTVMPRQAEETFVALRRLGKDVVLVRYEGEGHHPGSWSAANAADFWRRTIGWFDRHLAPSARGAGAAAR